jgi:hypothetical protein
VLDFLEQEKIVPDREKARELIRSAIDPAVLAEGKCSFDDFTKLFCKGIFKNALMRIANKVLQHGNNSNTNNLESSGKANTESGLNLESKMNNYNRHKLINGLDIKNETHKEVKQTLFALD